MATANPIQPIQPVNIPSGAGVSYGEGDVRHFAQGDEVSVPGISSPTRHLAERDNLLAEKLNEVIQSVNNQEQFVPLPVVRTVLTPSDQSTVLNYRIPPGFESRVLNAIISSTPASTDIELEVSYNASFGGTSGTSVVNTSSEFNSGVNFYQTGEFIVTLKNKGGVALEVAASVLLTLRPIGGAGSLLVGSIIKGDKGDTGQAGPPGPKGEPGTGGAGSVGMYYAGSWAQPTSYNKNDIVRYDLWGTVTSSFICTNGHTSSSGNAPDGWQTDTWWDALALGGTGPAGPKGNAGADGPAGDGVRVKMAHRTSAQLTLRAGTPFVGASISYGDPNRVYTTGSVKIPGDSAIIPCDETYYGVAPMSTLPALEGAGTLVYLSKTVYAIFRGWGTLILPQTTDAVPALTNYNTSQIKLTACVNGSNTVEWATTNGTVVPDVISYPTMDVTTGKPAYVVAVLNTVYPTPVIITVAGMQTY